MDGLTDQSQTTVTNNIGVDCSSLKRCTIHLQSDDLMGGIILDRASVYAAFRAISGLWSCGFSCYLCPSGEKMPMISEYRGSESAPGYKLYGTQACGNCDQRTSCTTAKAGRRITRYAVDECKEALRLVMKQEPAKARFGLRQAWVEPVFSVLRGNQGLNRFRRKGMMGVRVEFGLHVLAYNIGRLIAFHSAGYIAITGYFGNLSRDVTSCATKSPDTGSGLESFLTAKYTLICKPA